MKFRAYWWLIVAAIVVVGIVVAPSVGLSALPGRSSAQPTPTAGVQPGAQPAETPTALPTGDGTIPANGNSTTDPSSPVSSLDPTPTPGSSAQTGQTGGAPNGPMKKEPAPIENVEIVVQESMPPKYVARVTYGLPSGCAQPGGHEVKREGDQIQITVSILLPADPNTVCTMIYGIDTVNIDLGSDFTSGTTYTVQVNDQTTTFTAQ